MGIVVDCSQPLDAAVAKSEGITAVIGYLSSIDGPKVWNGNRLQNCWNYGLATGFVFEDGVANMLGGGPQGYRDASVALWEIAALFGEFNIDVTGTEIGVYFADDHNPVTNNAGAYMKAAQGVVESHGLRCGYYGNETGATFLLGMGVTHLGWGVSTWGSDLLKKCHLRQEANVPQMIVAGVPCDVDTTLATDWGQWPRP